MADHLSSRGAETRYPNGDPFAELSRIMGGGAPARHDQPSGDQDDFDLDLERELIAEPDYEPEPVYARQAAPVAEPAPLPLDDYADPLADEFADAFAAEFGPEGPARVAAPVDADLHSWQRDAGEGRIDEPGGAYKADDAVLAEVDMDFGDLDLSDDMPALEDDSVPAASAADPQAFPPPAPPSMEDELNALLAAEDGGGHAAPEPVPYIPLRASHAPAAASHAGTASWQDQDEAYAEPDDFVGRDDFSRQDDFAGHDDFQPDEPAFAGGAEAEPQPHTREDDPFAIFAAMAPAAPVLAGAGRFSRPAAPAALPEQASPELADDYATADVSEAAVPVQDDLDLPEIAYDDEPLPQPVDPEYDFGDLGLDQPVAAAAGPAMPPAREPVYEDPQPLHFEDDYAAPHADDALYAEYAAAQQDEYADETPALAQAVPAEPEEKRRNNGILIAAAVVGVALLGGIGAFALSFGDSGGSSAPTLVRADSEPLKVRPENPGGTAVPNQDSQAYQRVAAGEASTAPQQERLVTAAEEPVSLTARAAEPVNGLPGVDDEIAELDDVPPPVKVEDRVEASLETPGVGADQDLVAVQPRRVRTMIVRPDGTLVPRDEVPMPAAAPASALAPANASGPLAAQGEAAVEAVRQAPLSPQGQDAASGLPAPRVVETVRITPEAPAEPAPAAPLASAPQEPAAPAPRPAETQRQTQVAQAAPAAARPQPAAPQPAPQAAAPGEWSMQIASQPSADGAQASYQDLARRYGSIIGGRGVNIVRADIPGKGTYYRVRIPSSTRAEAISLCERYKAAGGSCFVSR